MKSSDLFRIVIFVMIAFSEGVRAQSPANMDYSRNDAEKIFRMTQDRLRNELESHGPKVKAPTGENTGSARSSTAPTEYTSECHVAKNIEISGASHLDRSARQYILDKYTGHCLGVKSLQDLIGEITAEYIHQGFITTRAYLPEQDVSSGMFTVQVQEGIVSAVNVSDTEESGISTATAFPHIEGRVLNLRDLEQGLDQLNRLSSNDAQIEITPGHKPGESVVVIHNKQRSRLSLVSGYDNGGSDATGKTQASVALGVDSPLGLNDHLSVSYRASLPQDPKRKALNIASAEYAMPYGYNTFSIGRAQADYVSMLPLSSGTELQSAGTSGMAFGKLDRVIFRDYRTRFNLSTALTTKTTRNYVDGTYLSVSSRRITTIGISASSITRLPGGILQTEVGQDVGIRSMDALRDASDLPSNEPHAQFNKYKASLRYTFPLKSIGQGLEFSTYFNGQRSHQALYGSEQLFIGGQYSIRGFDKNFLSGDAGYFWQNEISNTFPIRLAGSVVYARGFVALDQGAVFSHALNAPEGRLWGAAMGISTSWQRWNVGCWLAKALAGPSGMHLESPQIGFSASLSVI